MSIAVRGNESRISRFWRQTFFFRFHREENGMINAFFAFAHKVPSLHKIHVDFDIVCTFHKEIRPFDFEDQ